MNLHSVYKISLLLAPTRFAILKPLFFFLLLHEVFEECQGNVDEFRYVVAVSVFFLILVNFLRHYFHGFEESVYVEIRLVELFLQILKDYLEVSLKVGPTVAELRDFCQSHELKHRELIFHIRILLALTCLGHEFVELLCPVPDVVLLHIVVGKQLLECSVVFICAFAGNDADRFRDDP